MSLSPLYVQYMVRMIGHTTSKSVFTSLDLEDQQRMFLAALLLHRDKDANDMVMDSLQNYGVFVCEHWLMYKTAVNQLNDEGVNKTLKEINESLERHKPGT